VAQVFNDNGSGVRGDLLAVAKAILTDPEATTVTGYGKLREPLLRLTGLWRAFNAIDASGGLNESNLIMDTPKFLTEGPLESPSVFNFFRPDYQRAGPLANLGLVVPEFQITNEFTLVTLENNLQQLAYQYVDSKGSKHAGPDIDSLQYIDSHSVMLHTAQWEGYAADPGTLVDKLNEVLMGGQMSSQMRSVLVNYAAAIPSTSPASRVVETAELIINSPQYAIQR
jgi:hypothetical protein